MIQKTSLKKIVCHKCFYLAGWAKKDLSSVGPFCLYYRYFCHLGGCLSFKGVNHDFILLKVLVPIHSLIIPIFFSTNREILIPVVRFGRLYV